MDEKTIYLVIIISTAIIGIISMIIMMLKYKKTITLVQTIRKRIIFQLNISCILHCFSHFFLIPDLSKNTELCQFEGALNFTFLLSTLIFTVQISFFSYHSEGGNNCFNNHKNLINIIFSVLAWVIPFVLCFICFVSSNMKPFNFKSTDDYNCSLNLTFNSLEILEYIYIAFLITGLLTNLIFTILMIIRNCLSTNREGGKNKRKFISCSLNIVTYLPTIIQHFIEIKKVSIPFEWIILIDFCECLSGIIYVIAFEFGNMNFCKKESENEMERLGELANISPLVE